MPYYGLYVPGKNGAAATTAEQSTSACPNVFDTKKAALDVLKGHKEARFRKFDNKDDAINYAQTGYEEIVPPKYADPKGASTAAQEKSAHRAPTKQELIEFRKKIETDDYETVKTVIWANPRYLVSSGDTPSTLKEGYRYNAMHVCALYKKPRIAELILQTVSDIKFAGLLTSKENDEKMCKELCSNLLDYYLNIPEKGRGETPLHLAAKIGSIEMVKVLTSYAECRMTRNNDGCLPKDIICSRQPNMSRDVYEKIEALLEERFYVPVLRAVDGAIPPEIGQPFPVNNPPNLNVDPLSPEVKIQALAGPMSMEQAKQFRRRWKTPPRIGSGSSPIANNPFISPRIGNPTSPNKSYDPRSSPANLQRRALFNSSPRNSPMEKDTRSLNSTTPKANTVADTRNGNHTTSNENTAEIVVVEEQTVSIEIANTYESNNNNNNNNTIPETIAPEIRLYPSTPLMCLKKSAFSIYREPINVDSPVTLDVVENGLVHSESAAGVTQEMHNVYNSPGFKERHIKITDTEKGLEVIGRELAKEQNVEWREYWDFLDTFIDITSTDGLLKLEQHFAQRVKEIEATKKTTKTMASATVALDEVCSALEKFGFSRDNNAHFMARNGLSTEDNSSNRSDTNSNATTSTNPAQATTPYTCVEKSLQVWAKRMTKTIIHNVENVVCINDTLLLELKRLKSLICSFKEDIRFHDVNFAKVHSRIGNLISIYLQSSQEVSLATQAKISVVIKNLQNTRGERREHMECVCARIYDKLSNHVEQILPENLKTEDMCSKAWLDELECECQWDSNLSRKTSRRSRMEARYKSHQANVRQQITQQEETEIIAAEVNDWRNVAVPECSDSSDEDVFWSDFGGSDTEDDDEYYTPPESPTRLEAAELESDDYKIYIYGDEPTKRDLDVLNAIFHIDIDNRKYPNIHSWKAALLNYSTEEMDYFPSPAVVKKSQPFALRDPLILDAPKRQRFNLTPTTSNSTPKQQQPQQLPVAKRLFSSPRSKLFGGLANDSGGDGGGGSGPPKTPLNKLRGLFSAYRETVDKSPLPTPTVYCTTNDRSKSDESNNLSLFNMSANE